MFSSSAIRILISNLQWFRAEQRTEALEIHLHSGIRFQRWREISCIAYSSLPSEQIRDLGSANSIRNLGSPDQPVGAVVVSPVSAILPTTDYDYSITNVTVSALRK
jgi:hypothetical protein